MSQSTANSTGTSDRPGTPAPYVPSLERTAGQPPSISANGGLSYMALDHDGDAGTGAALRDVIAQIGTGEGQRILDAIANAPPGPIMTPWGEGFRTFDECIEHIRATDMELPPNGIAVPLCYTVDERYSYSIVPSHAIWRSYDDPELIGRLRANEEDVERRKLYFPQILHDGRAVGDRYPGLSPDSPESLDRLGLALTNVETGFSNYYDAADVRDRYYPEIEQLLLRFFPDATDALVYNHDIFDKDYEGTVRENQAAKDPGVNRGYANMVHNDLNDNSGRLRCRELLTKNLRNFGRMQTYNEEQADAKMSRRFISINLAKPMETVEQYPLVLCAWPSFADQPYITSYRIYDDRVGETTRFTHRPGHEWYWFPQQASNELSIFKCYDSITDGSVARWSFHTACFDPTAPSKVRNRRNIVVRAYVFF